MFFILKKKKYIQPIFQKLIQVVKNKKFNAEKQGWHYFAVRKLSVLLRGKTLKNNGAFYCLNCLHAFRTNNKLMSYKKVCKERFL